MKFLNYLPLLLLLLSGCGEEKSKTSNTDTTDNQKPDGNIGNSEKGSGGQLGLEIHPENFVKGVTNPYFSIVPGRKFYFDGQNAQGIKIHKELLSSERTKEVLGVTTQGVWEREWHNESLVSDTKKWYAQDKGGNVWIFAEDDLNIFGGFSKGPGESWQAGVGEAKAGIVVPGELTVGTAIPSEHTGYGDKKSEVLAVGESVKTANGALEDCLKIGDIWSSQNVEEHQYYCKETGNLSLEVTPNSFGKLELTKIEDNFSTAGMDIKYPDLKVNLSEEKAKEIALKQVDNAKEAGEVSLKLWDNKPAFEVQVTTAEDKIILVYLNVLTGALLKIVDQD